MKKYIKRFFLGIVLLTIIFLCYFFTIRQLDHKTENMNDYFSSVYNVKEARLLPSGFINGQRFYVKIKTKNGDTLIAFCDTGGGLSMMLPQSIGKYSLKSMVKYALVKGIMPVKYIQFGDLVADEHIPPPVHLRRMILRRPFARVAEPYLIVPPNDGETKFFAENMNCDMFFGQDFFMGKSWTIDYTKQEVWVNTPISALESDLPGVQHVGFKKNRNNESSYGHPSMYIEVDGEVIDVLFDTGASIVLSEDVRGVFNTQEKTIAGSFIAASVFDKWRADHPDWRYFEKADNDRDMIEVPVVNIGGYDVGPVLFAKRKDESWSENMIHSMDKIVKGAVGGSALKFFKVTIDYNSELIKFERTLNM